MNSGRLDGQPCREEGAQRDAVITVRGEEHTLQYECRMNYRRNQLMWTQVGLRR